MGKIGEAQELAHACAAGEKCTVVKLSSLCRCLFYMCACVVRVKAADADDDDDDDEVNYDDVNDEDDDEGDGGDAGDDLQLFDD